MGRLGRQGFLLIKREFNYPGYRRFFSLAAGIFVVGRRPKPRAAKRREKPQRFFARVTIKTRQKPETALEKTLAPRVETVP